MPRVAVFSDVHANLPALESVLDDVEKRGVEACWYLGDILVYGPHPGECIDRMRTLCEQWPCVIVRGNNDHAIIRELLAQRENKQESNSLNSDWLARAGIVDPSDPREAGRQEYIVATELSHAWTVEQLTPEQQDWLISVPSSAQRPPEMEHVLLVHASPCDSTGEEGNYLHEPPDAEEAWLSLEQPLCFFGHTHCSVVFRRAHSSRLYDNTEKISRPDQPIAVDDRPLLVNPGSVGQPRDGLPTASYAVYDSEAQRIEFYRVEYDISKAVRAMESTRDSLEKVMLDLNAHSDSEPPPYKLQDVDTTIELLSKRLKEAR
jgi:predicted phosphodiesterase